MKTILAILAICLVTAVTQGATRLWTGGGGNNNWSTAGNWSPAGTPANGDRLYLQTAGATTVNNLPGLVVEYLLVHDGQTVNGDLIIANNRVEGGDGVNTIRADVQLIAETHFVSLNGLLLFAGNVDVNGRLLWTEPDSTGVVEFGDSIGGNLTGNGTVLVTGPGTTYLSGTVGNGFTGTMYVGGTLGCRKVNGTDAITGRLEIGSGGVVSLYRTGQVGSLATIVVNSGGELVASTVTNVIPHLELVNDAIARVSAGGQLAISSNLTVRATNGTAIIKGELAVLVTVLLDVSGSASPQLDIVANISGDRITKVGTGRAIFRGTNTFTGTLFVNEGTIEAQSDTAFGSTLGSTVLNNGAIILRGAAIGGERMTVNGSDYQFTGAYGSLLFGYNNSSWAGAITLLTNLVVYSGDTTILSGVISGPGGLDTFYDTVRLSGSSGNTYSGTTRVIGGTLELQKTSGDAVAGPLIIGDGIGGAGSDVVRLLDFTVIGTVPVTVTGSGLLDLNNRDENIGELILEGGVVTMGSGTLTVLSDVTTIASASTATISGNLNLGGATRIFDVANGSPDCDLTISAVISNGGITKTGAGRLCASGNSTYTGLITVGAGFLRVDSDNGLGSASGGTTVGNGATLTYVAALNSVPEHVTLNGHGVGKTNGALNASGTVTQFGSVTLQSAATIRTESGAQFSIPSVIDGTGDLTKAGPGTLTFNGVNANTYLGETFVDEGWLQLGKVGQVSIPGPVAIGSGPPERLSARLRYLAGASFAVAGGFTVNEASLLDLNGQSESFSLPGVPLTLNDGGDVQTGAGLLTLKAGSTVVVNPGTVGSSSITGRLGLDASLALGDNQTFNVGSGGAGIPLTISASMEATTARAANVVKTGSGEMWLNGANTFAGSLSVNDGRMTLGSSTAAGAVGGGVFVNNGGVLALAGSLAINSETLTLNSTAPVPLIVLSGASYWNGGVSLARATTIQVDAGASLEVYSSFGGSGALTKTGPGGLQLDGGVGSSNTNTTMVSEGFLVLNTTPSVQAIIGPLIIGDGIGGADADVVRLLRNYQIGNNVSVTINFSGLLDLNGVTDGFRALSGSGHLELNGGLIAVNYPDATSTFDGVISGAGIFYKEGSGTLTLNGNNTLYQLR